GPPVGYQHRPGALAVIGTPELFENTDGAGRMSVPWGRSSEEQLLAENRNAIDASRTRLLGNIVDTMVYGESLLEVRKALTPVSRRIKPWTAQEKMRWTLLVVALVPCLVALAGLGVTILRRRKRAAYETAANALGRESKTS
ncbi:MAG: hypothetical protein KDB07_05745, partial [Planctomycetes bacterium]|nr:hypothetical protein [Planctomycetota bacterium]